jgi:hypothetical protein
MKPAPSYTNLVILFLVSLCFTLSMTVFFIILNQRMDDTSSRQRIQTESAALEDVLMNLHNAQIIENALTLNKARAAALESEYAILKNNITQNYNDLLAIDDLSVLGSNVTTLIATLNATYNEQIYQLEQAFLQLLSVADDVSSVSLRTGNCTVQGVTAASVTYDYRRATVNGLDFFYYVFGQTPASVDIDSMGVSIENCTPLPLYQGPNRGVFVPVFKTQLKKFAGDGAEEITHVGAGDGKLQFMTTAFVGTKSFEIAESLTHFVEFF